MLQRKPFIYLINWNMLRMKCWIVAVDREGPKLAIGIIQTNRVSVFVQTFLKNKNRFLNLLKLFQNTTNTFSSHIFRIHL